MTTDPEFPLTVVGHLISDAEGYRAFFGDERIGTLPQPCTATGFLDWLEKQCTEMSRRLNGRIVAYERDFFWALK
jgi:hypothetical protein